ncbi:hypothetical protein FOZ61_002247 [Perkinsus olseni]|uniref:Uncharacterized protein n=1 Tax=Perkinsus olseni TaxID=32597 RepID=A0A7J6LTW9_PEROL|nr:hypothetical protein FOZ61_002247 [Perkinsus olseni]KAF4668581.1 hypothetical protein FOL46_001903 [Perkinsus olseni]
MTIRKDSEEEEGRLTGRRLTEDVLKGILDSDKNMYYRTRELNDKLYIHYGGYRKLENLDQFTGLKVLYAECNGFSKIEGLEYLTALRSLFLGQNCIEKIENLQNNLQLWTLSLPDNFIKRIENISHLRKLNTINLANNQIGMGGVDDIASLLQPSTTDQNDGPINATEIEGGVAVVDLTNNKLEDPAIVDEVLVKMKGLKVLYLKGNPVVKKIPNYRKTLIAKMPNLKYLDDRPIFADERRLAEAFYYRGGIETEREERKLIRQEKEEERRRNMRNFDLMIRRAREEFREGRLMRGNDDRYPQPEDDPVDTIERRRERWAQRNREIIGSSSTAEEDGMATLQQPQQTDRNDNRRDVDNNDDDDDADSTLSTSCSTAESQLRGGNTTTATRRGEESSDNDGGNSEVSAATTTAIARSSQALWGDNIFTDGEERRIDNTPEVSSSTEVLPAVESSQDEDYDDDDDSLNGMD